ncbi:unnamed protein product [Bathycoccus prasinos]
MTGSPLSALDSLNISRRFLIVNGDAPREEKDVFDPEIMMKHAAMMFMSSPNPSAGAIFATAINLSLEYFLYTALKFAVGAALCNLDTASAHSKISLSAYLVWIFMFASHLPLFKHLIATYTQLAANIELENFKAP